MPWWLPGRFPPLNALRENTNSKRAEDEIRSQGGVYMVDGGNLAYYF